MTAIQPVRIARSSDRVLTVLPWPRRTDLHSTQAPDGLQWGTDGAEPTIVLTEAKPALLGWFLRLLEGDKAEIEEFARLVGPIRYCDACPRLIHAPRLGPINSSLTSAQRRGQLQGGPRAHREAFADYSLLAGPMAAARRVARRLEAMELGSEDDWKYVLPGRWRLDPPRAPSWPAVADSWGTGEEQKDLLAGVLSGWLAGAHVVPQLRRTGDGFSLVLSTSGLLGVLVSELVLAVGGGIQHLGEPCEDGCGRLVQVRRYRGDRLVCATCRARIRQRNKRQRDRAKGVSDGSPRK